MKYVKAKAIKDWAKEHDRQASKDFLETIDRKVEYMLEFANRQWSGHHKRLTAELLPKGDKKDGPRRLIKDC